MKALSGIVFFFIVLVLVPVLFQRTGRTDLGVVMTAAARLDAHETVYRIDDLNEHNKPPMVAMLFVPLLALPLFWLERVWDLLNLFVFVALALLLVRENLPPGRRFWAALLPIYILLNPWSQEIRLGQYNFALFAFAVWAGWRRRDRAMEFAWALAVMFKPVFLFLGPWIFRRSRRPGRIAAICLALAAATALAFVAVYGRQWFVSEMQSWLAFLPPSTEKNLIRRDNFGLAAGWPVLSANQWMLVGLGASALAAWLCTDALAALAVASVALVLCVPIAWYQNYTMLLPALIWVCRAYTHARGAERVLLATSLAVLWAGTGLLNPYACKFLPCALLPGRYQLWFTVAAIVLVAISQAVRSLGALHFAGEQKIDQRS